MEEDDGYRFLNPKSKLAMYAKNLIFIVAMIAVDVILCIFRADLEADMAAIYILTGVIAVISLCLLIWPMIFYRHYRYIVDTEKVDVRSGVFFIRRTVVPIERIHQVQVRTGPLSNRVGLADVWVTTAGGNAVIQYLDREIAESIAEYLKDSINKIIRDRETE